VEIAFLVSMVALAVLAALAPFSPPVARAWRVARSFFGKCW
jgi:hypothetical protein